MNKYDRVYFSIDYRVFTFVKVYYKEVISEFWKLLLKLLIAYIVFYRLEEKCLPWEISRLIDYKISKNFQFFSFYNDV